LPLIGAFVALLLASKIFDMLAFNWWTHQLDSVNIGRYPDHLHDSR
jgi:hypothetical protein